MVQLVPLATYDHGFKESWRFGDVPFASFYGAFFDVYVDVAVSLNARYVVHFKV
jgi:hypothetical protein